MLALGASIIPNMPGLPLTSYPTVGLFMLAAGLAMFKGCGRYMRNHGSGGPDPRTPATQLVTVGPYAYTRNPMYIGHLIWLSGLTIFTASPVALGLTLFHAAHLHMKVLTDEAILEKRFGEPYQVYKKTVPRWLPIPTRRTIAPRT